MKKYIIIMLCSLLLIAAFFTACDVNDETEFEHTLDERIYVNGNKDRVFFVGYYNTPEEERFVNELCGKMSDDTVLNFVPVEATWKENLSRLEVGSITMLINMMKTDEAEVYADFTNALDPLVVGLFSDYNNKIISYNDLEDKTIGVEKGSNLVDELRLKFPEINFDAKYYNDLDKLIEAKSNGEIDGFLSVESKSRGLNTLYFYPIDTLSQDNNYIGVNEGDDMLFQIINKEIDCLIASGWEAETKALSNFTLETEEINFTNEEKLFLENSEYLIVGISTDYSYYAYGEEDYLKGIVPSFFEKVQFLTDLEFVFRYDNYQQLLEREDIDLIISSEVLPYMTAAPMFSNNLIVVSHGKMKEIDETYELESYKVGMMNDRVVIDELNKTMPYIDIKLYSSYDQLYKSLENYTIDYAIVPEELYSIEQAKKSLISNGVIDNKVHYIYSKNNDGDIISIINKCLYVIDMDSLVREETEKLILDEENVSQKVVVIALIVITCIAIIIGIIVYILKLKNRISKLLYLDEETLLYNDLWLRHKLKINYNGYVNFLVSPKNITQILERYGENAYKRAIKIMLDVLKSHVNKGEYLVKVLDNKYLLIKKDMTESDRIIYMHKLKELFNKKFSIFDINYSYEMNVVSLKPEDEKYTYEKLMKELKIGMNYSEVSGEIVDYTYDVFSKYHSKIEYDTKLSSAIINEELTLNLNKIYDREDRLYGYDVSISCDLGELGEISFVNLKRAVKRLDLEKVFDKIVLKKLLNKIEDEGYEALNYFIEIDRKSLESENFYDWLKEKMMALKGVKLFVKTDMDTYENQLEVFDCSLRDKIDFAIGNFGRNLTEDCLVKDYEATLVELNASLFTDIEQNKEIIDFIIAFCKKYDKKMMVTAINTRQQLAFIKEYNIDYYNNKFRSNEDESINR